MKKILLFTVLVVSSLMSATVSEKDRALVMTYLSALDGFNTKFVSKIELTQRDSFFAVHLLDGINYNSLFYVNPTQNLILRNLPNGVNIKNTDEVSTSLLDYRAEITKQYIGKINTDGYKKDLFSFVAPSSEDTEISLFMFTDSGCGNCKEAYRQLDDSIISVKKINIAYASSDDEVIKRDYKGDKQKFKEAKFLASKFNVIKTPTFLVYNNHMNRFIDVITMYPQISSKNKINEISEYNKRISKISASKK